MAKVPTYIDKLPFNIESLVGMIMQYSPDIEWDWSSGIYPTGEESAFKWVSNFQPVKYINSEYVEHHVWTRFKFNNAGVWSIPFRLTGKKGEKGEHGVDGENTLEKLLAKFPIKFNLASREISHELIEGTNHIPSGGIVGQFVKKLGTNSYGWGTIETFPALDDLTDVTIITPLVTNQVLLYDGTQWINGDAINSESEWHLEFYNTIIPIKLFYNNNITLNSVSTSNVVSYEFSYNLSAWVTPVFPYIVPANTPFTVRVTEFNNSAISANLIIKYTKQ